jgi:hypothetical protein
VAHAQLGAGDCRQPRDLGRHALGTNSSSAAWRANGRPVCARITRRLWADGLIVEKSRAAVMRTG